jgi:hypothetical protein
MDAWGGSPITIKFSFHQQRCCVRFANVKKSNWRFSKSKKTMFLDANESVGNINDCSALFGE